MKKTELLLKRLDEIGVSLEKSEHALALMGVGSVGAERARLDEYSDLDFFVIVKDGYKNTYLKDYFWLTEIAPLAFAFQDTPDGHKVLFEDGIFCEFAVFECWELKNIAYSEFHLVWKAEDFDSNQITLVNKNQPPKRTMDYLVKEALTNLYVGMSRECRGERGSAFAFIQQYAVTRIMDLCPYLLEEQPVFKDKFATERRFEQRFPEMKEMLPLFMQGYEKNRESAKEILKFLDTHFEVNERLKQEVLKLIAKD